MKMDEALKMLERNGYKLTNRRKDMIEYFSRENKYKTAKELHQHMKNIYSSISFDTVYRNLHLYEKLGILETTELEAEKHFRMTCSETHHHHFICKTCRKTKKLNFCPMIYVEDLLQQYEIKGHKFEVYGQCPNCFAS